VQSLFPQKCHLPFMAIDIIGSLGKKQALFEKIFKNGV